MFRNSVIRSARAATTAASFRRTTVAGPAAVRTFAAATAGENNVQLPTSVFGLDGTYANALYTAAAKTSSVEPLARAMSQLESALAQDNKLEKILANPTLAGKDRAEIVKELQRVVGGAGSNNTLSNFLGLLAENNRLNLLRGVCEKFGILVTAAAGQIEMVVTSAQPLDSRTLGRLQAAAQKSEHVQSNQKLKVTNKVNPDIVGGLIVEVGDRTIDLSVSSRVAKLNKLMSDTL